MASSFWDTTSVTEIIGTMFDNLSVRELRPKYIFDSLSQDKNWQLSNPPKKGDTMTFVTLGSYTANTAALDATNDSVSGGKTPSFARKSVSLELYGDHSSLDIMGMAPETFVDSVSDAAWAVGDQGMNSMNKIARAVWDKNKYSNEASGTISSTYHYYGSDGTIGSIGSLKAVDVRKIFTDLKASNVKTFNDGLYRFVVDPIQAQQLRAETGNAAWRFPHANQGELSRQIVDGEIGSFEGFMFVANNEVLGAGTGTITGYAVGEEAVGKAVGSDINISPNKVLRGTHENILILKWNSLVGYRVVRREALRTIETNNTRL